MNESATGLDNQQSPETQRNKTGTSASSHKAVSYDDYKVMNDPIHGHIPLHPLLVKIIDTAQFQRLRNIKQLGGLYFVYPGASHNRFEHSIGVAYLAEKLVRMLKERQEYLKISEEDILCVAIAGLCHDLGHGPFSHLFDGVFLPEALSTRKWKHEDVSCVMLDHLIEENNLKQDFETFNLKDTDIVFIKEMIAGPQSDDSAEKDGVKSSTNGNGDWRYKGRESSKSFLYEIVSNDRNKMDVDKWDYFARDCHHLGIRNSFDHTRFMQFMKVLESDDGQRQLCVRDKELVNLCEMFHTRSILHQRAYQHKTCLAIELMISKALVKADEHITKLGKEGKSYSISSCIEDPIAYTKLNDDIFYEILNSECTKMVEARKLLERIHKRKLFVCIGAVPLPSVKDPQEDSPTGAGILPDASDDTATQKNAKEYDEANANKNTAPPRYQTPVKKGPSVQSKQTDVSIKPEDIIALDSKKTLENGDIIVSKTKIDHGQGPENPVNNFSFFRKSDKDKAYIIPESEISKMLMIPERFQDKKIMIWCTSNDDKKIDTAKECLKKWKNKNPSISTLDITWTPMREERRRNSAKHDDGKPMAKKQKLEYY